jgi:hypothetical protein
VPPTKTVQLPSINKRHVGELADDVHARTVLPSRATSTACRSPHTFTSSIRRPASERRHRLLDIHREDAELGELALLTTHQYRLEGRLVAYAAGAAKLVRHGITSIRLCSSD